MSDLTTIGDLDPRREIMITALQREVVTLREENLALKQRLAAAEVEPRTPDDFASALQQSLDTMQRRLAATGNPVSDFAVRELRLEANVHLEVTKLGMLHYRFPGSGDVVDPASLSKLTLAVVPLPKPDDAGGPGRLTPDIAVSEIHGIGAAYQRELNKAGLFTVGELFAAGSRARSLAELESMLRIDRRRLGEWLEHAALLHVREIDGRTASILHEAGIRDLETLADRDPADVVRSFTKVSGTRKGPRRELSEDEAARWIATARTFLRRGDPADGDRADG